MSVDPVAGGDHDTAKGEKDAREVLLAAAASTEQDHRPSKRAVGSLWSGLHAVQPAHLRLVFDALAAECGVSDPTAYLGDVLRRMSPAERGAACRAAAERIEAA